jgi:hypothetical protein
VAELPLLGSIIHEEDDTNRASDPIRIIICMSKDSSKRLLDAQFLQSDIGFKRIVGFQEFELGGRDHGSRTGVSVHLLLSVQYLYLFPAFPYCRVYLNRQTAAAHHFIFKKIEEIVTQDTGKSLQWRHLHATTMYEYVGILHWAADQHGGQAKGESNSAIRVSPGLMDHGACRPWPASQRACSTDAQQV